MLDEFPVTIKLSDEIIVKADSDLEISKESSRFKEHLQQSFELDRSSISSHLFWEVSKAFKQKSKLSFTEIIKSRAGQ